MSSRAGQLRRVLESHGSLSAAVQSLAEMIELAEGEEDESFHSEIERELAELEKKYDEYELAATLSGENDRLNAFVTIHPGAGGTESCDWANMLMRMYLRFFEEQGWLAE